MRQPTVAINARIPEHLAVQLRAQAAENDRTMAGELKRAIANHVNPPTTGDSRRELPGK